MLPLDSKSVLVPSSISFSSTVQEDVKALTQPIYASDSNRYLGSWVPRYVQ